MTVTVALIVKNEERTLRRCLDSLYRQVDEIVVVDTGSEDATKAVAQGYTDRVFDFPWRQDFAAARQFAFDQAMGDWVVWVDADDVVQGAEHIKPLAASAPADVGVFYWRYITGRDKWGNPLCEFWRERCIRNDGSFRWVGRVHETLIPQRSWATVRSREVVVEHRSEMQGHKDKGRRNLDILEAEYAASMDAPSPRLLFYLGREYAGAGDIDQALSYLQRYLDVATWDDERYLAQSQVAELHRTRQCYELAIEADWQALKICPHWPQAYFGLARSYYFLRDWPKVIHWTDVGRAMPWPETLHILTPLDYRYNWMIYYTNALFYIGEIEEALTWTRRALEICPDDPWHQQNFLVFAGALQANGKERQRQHYG